MEGLSQRMRISWEIIQIIGKVYAFTVMEPKQLGIPSVTAITGDIWVNLIYIVLCTHIHKCNYPT